MLSLIVSLLFSSVSCRRTDYSRDVLQNEITSLPGLDDETFKQYTMFSGYINVFPAHNRSLFYWFVESLSNPTKDPVALWTNGGPGCSGLGGMFTENGPFRPKSDLTLYVNNYSWVNVANMLFIEAPAGVGFSFSDKIEDYKTNDTQTALDNYNLIRFWLQAFPNYATNDFYLTSESYGGHYLPTLAQQIVLGNNAGNKPQVNFKGFFVGNPYTDPVENEKGQYDTWFGHQLVSYPSWKRWYDECDNGNRSGVQCAAARETLNSEVGEKIDPYALDFPVCIKDERVWFMKNVIKGALKRPVPGLYAKFVQQLEDSMEKSFNFGFSSDGYYPCESKWNTKYLNQASVQSAIHAKPADWTMCSIKVEYASESMKEPMEPIYKWLVSNGDDLHITIVSGDDDSVCGTLGTQSWIWDMGYTVEPEYNWRHWTDSEGQVGGYIIKFEKAFNFITVHSAGHMIPETQPMRSLEAFTMYLKGI